MRQMSLPSSTPRTVTAIDTFKGVDLTNAPNNVSISRSPNAPNMIRDTPGKVRKRMGYKLDHTYSAKIYGVFHLDATRLVHSGTNLYSGDTVLYSDMNASRSKAVQHDGKLYIVDGKTLLVYGKFDDTMQVKKVSDIGYVPTVYAGVSYQGGGKSIEDFNLLQPKFKILAYGDGSNKVFQLPVSELSNDYILVEKLNSSGDWETMSTGYSVDYTLGKITFNTAPSAPTISGTDNLRITCKKVITGYVDMVNKCTILTLYGVGGNPDTLFLSGNPDYPNRDWHSAVNDPSFIPDTSYQLIGQDDSEVVGYSLVNNYLAVHKSSSEDGRNVLMRYAEQKTDSDGLITTLYPIKNTIQGDGAVGKYNFAYLSESLFATNQGICAITSADITGEKYTQNRSFYLNGALKEEDLKNAYAVIYNNFYVLATTNRVYLLDGLQRVYEKNSPYSNFQYEGYYWEIPNISVLFVEGNILCFGTNDGKIMKFCEDKNDPASYNDNGVAIPSRWDTTILSGDVFYKKKNFRFLSAVIAPAIITGFTAYAQIKGVWTKLYDTSTKARYFDFSYIDFGKINFFQDNTPRTLGHKIRLKRVDKVMFSFRNEELNEPFAVYSIGTEFTENGNYKG